MSRETLQVNTAHLCGLAAKHGLAAAEINSAVDAVSGVDRGIRTSHGVIASSTAAAVEVIQQARRDAGASVAVGSRSLSDNLTGAACRYKAADRVSGVDLDKQMSDSMSPPERLGR